MTDRPHPNAFALRYMDLRDSMPGFDGLILAVQGLLVGVSLATGEIWGTPDVETTLQIARTNLRHVANMTDAFGVEQ